MSGSTEITDRGSASTRDLAHPVYIYGVIPSREADGWPETETAGLDGLPSSTVRTVVEGGLAALVSDLPPDYVPGRREDIDAHRRVLSLAISRGTAIPMRFGMVMDGDEVVRKRLLARHADELQDLLRDLDGHVQMMVKGFYADDALLRDVLAARPDLANESAALAQRPEAETHAARVRLGELVAEAVEARRAEVQSALVDRLAPVSEDILVEPETSERVALNVQVLVKRDRRPDLDEVILDMSEDLAGAVAFRYIGPLPPYSFADLSLEEEEEPSD